jgi:hypothetical protein
MDRIEAAQKTSLDGTNQAMMQLQVTENLKEKLDEMIQRARDAEQRKFQKTTTEVVTKLLTPAQQKRLVQIDLQVRGYESFTLPAIAKTLEITAKQKEELATIAKQVPSDIQTALQKPAQNINPNALIPVEFDFEKLIKDARDNATKRALAILTDEQKTKWKAITGDPFTHPINRPFNGTAFDLPGIGGGNFQVLPALPPVPEIPDPAKP